MKNIIFQNILWLFLFVDLVSHKNSFKFSFPKSLYVSTRLWGRGYDFHEKAVSWFVYYAYIQKVKHFPSGEDRNLQSNGKTGTNIICSD